MLNQSHPKSPSIYLVSAFVGLAAGLGGITALVWGRGAGSDPGSRFLIGVRPATDPAWTAEWASGLVPAAAAQEAAFTGLMGVLTATILLAGAAAAVCGILLLAEERLAASRTVAIQSALGIDRWRLLRGLVEGVGVRGRRAGAVGLGAVLFSGLAIRWTWPDQVLGWSWLDGVVAFGAGATAVAVVLATTLLPGLAIWGHKRLFTFLSRQSSAFPDRGESFGRDVAVVCQVAVAVSVLVLIGGLVGSNPDRGPASALGEDTVAIPMEVAMSTPAPVRAQLYESLLEGLMERPGVEAESIASSGALLGLGANGMVVTQCGRCIIGLLYVPQSVAMADHHAVGPGFFGLAGFEIVSGRDFSSTDVWGAAGVAIVNKSLADAHFEDGNPLGRGIQIGGPRGEWYEVIGVVEEPRAVAMGAQSSRRPALYLSAFQVPPARSTLIVRPSPLSAATSAASSAPLSGVDLERLAALVPSAVASGVPRTVATVRRMSWAPVSWLRQVFLGVAAIALLVVLSAVRAVMRVSVERSAAEIGLRMAIGATPVRIGTLVIRRSFKRLSWGTVIGIFFGLIFLGQLQGAIPEMSPPPIAWVLAWTAVLALVAVWGAWAPARHAAGEDPARVLANG